MKTKINISAFRETINKEKAEMLTTGICLLGTVLIVSGTVLVIFAILMGWLLNLV